MNTITQVTPHSAGALTFNPDGVLFVGGNKLGAVFASETEPGQRPDSLVPFLFESIDEKIADELGVTAKSLDTGDLTLETLMVAPMPARIDEIWVEMDFPRTVSTHKLPALTGGCEL